MVPAPVGHHRSAVGQHGRLGKERGGEHRRRQRPEQGGVEAGAGGDDEVDGPAHAAVDHGAKHLRRLVHDRAQGEIDGVGVGQCGQVQRDRGVRVDLAG
jgi:hypothetical protein